MHIPGVLTRHDPVGTQVPVLFDSPHSGSEYPADFQPSAPMAALRSGEDAFIEELFGAAPSRGAILIEAHFPRVYIDPNRALTDMDQELLSEPWPEPLFPGEKTRLGQGLIRRYALPGMPVHGRTLTVAEAKARIERYYRPYHDAIAAAYREIEEAFGTVWHVNCHSMKSVGNAMNTDNGARRPDFVLGDRDGTTCDPAFVARVREVVADLGYSVTINDPYKGVELVRRYSDPRAGRHALQIEVNRGLYMDEAQIARSAGFDKVRRDVTTLVDGIVDFARSR